MREPPLSSVPEPGYREISRPGEEYPMMSLSVAHGVAVVHYFRDAKSCFLLSGDGVTEDGASLDFPILDVVVPFTSEFICDAVHAQGIVEAFARGTDLEALGAWTRL